MVSSVGREVAIERRSVEVCFLMKSINRVGSALAVGRKCLTLDRLVQVSLWNQFVVCKVPGLVQAKLLSGHLDFMSSRMISEDLSNPLNVRYFLFAVS